MREGTNNSEHWALARLHGAAAKEKALELSERCLLTYEDYGLATGRCQIILNHLERAHYWKGKTSGPLQSSIEA